jgi:outer membrane receptor for ferrienterochelin and colicin
VSRISGNLDASRKKRWRSLCTASGLAICLAHAAPLSAQDAEPAANPEEDEAEPIVVSGYRASLESAQSIKQEADTFVDVITAEDIGALPDRSVAEALQRVPGVNISRFEQRNDPDRFSVEGSGVIIRGLPFVRSELNGRDIFSANGGRELSFNDVSPELLGRVEVFKNVTADMIEGALSGTVNLVTRKPSPASTSRERSRRITATWRKSGRPASRCWRRTRSTPASGRSACSSTMPNPN